MQKYVYILDNDLYGLSSREFSSVKVSGEDIPTIEKNLLRENIGQLKITQTDLKEEKGSHLAERLLKILRVENKSGESKKDYLSRLLEETLGLLNIRDVFQ